jgi:hypothetical protein
MKRLGLVVGIVCAVLFSARAAHAGLVFGADVRGSKPVGDGSDQLSTGLGIDVRLGYRLPLLGVDVVPELTFGFTQFGAANGGNTTLGFYTGMAGARVIVTMVPVLHPFVFAHVGLGHTDANGSGYDVTGSGTAFDGGGGVIFTALPIVDLGVFAGYTQVSGGAHSTATVNGVQVAVGRDSSTQWVDFGGFLGFKF